MASDSSHFSPSSSPAEPARLYPFRATSRRGFVKALLALLGAFSLARYFKWNQPTGQSRATCLEKAKKTLADKRAVVYTPQSPFKKTNA